MTGRNAKFQIAIVARLRCRFETPSNHCRHAVTTDRSGFNHRRVGDPGSKFSNFQ